MFTDTPVPQQATLHIRLCHPYIHYNFLPDKVGRVGEGEKDCLYLKNLKKVG